MTGASEATLARIRANLATYQAEADTPMSRLRENWHLGRLAADQSELLALVDKLTQPPQAYQVPAQPVPVIGMDSEEYDYYKLDAELEDARDA